MVPVDLITGALGAGKTTFIRRYADFLKRKGIRAAVIENEFGQANVDAVFLSDMEDDACSIGQVTGACICCGGEQKLRNLLFTFSHSGADRIIIEPSGIYDAGAFFHVMEEEPVCRWCCIGSVIAAADAAPQDFTPETAYLTVTQLSSAGAVLLSKTAQHSAESAALAVQQLKELCAKAGCSLQGEILCKDWDSLTDEDFERLMQAGYHREPYRRLNLDHNALFHAVTLSVRPAEPDALRTALRTLLSQDGIFRAKGFVPLKSGGAAEVNCTRDILQITPLPDESAENRTLTVIGTAPDAEQIAALF